MTTNNASPTKRFGSKGLSIWSGRVQIGEEYLSALQNWQTAAKVYKEMQDDVVIGTLLDAIKAPLLAAEFDVIPGGDSQADEDAAAFLWDNMNSMNQQTWRSHVTDMLEAIDFGFALGEILLDKRDDGHLWLQGLEPRGQETVDRWEWDDEEEVVTGVIQRHAVTGKELTIPIAKVVHVTFRGRKGNPQGKPLLRSLYRPWRFLKNMENLEGIGVERDVGGTPVFTEPENEYLQASDITEIDTMLKGLRMDEMAFVRLPSGSTLTAFGGGSKMYDVGAIIERKEKQILGRVFAQFLKLGMDTVGTQALVKGSQDFFSLGLKSVQQQLLEAWNQQLVPFVFQFNHFPGMTANPEITWLDAGQIDVKSILDAYTTGVSARVITPVEEDEDHVRGLLDLPDRPEGVGEGPREAPAGPTMLPFIEKFTEKKEEKPVRIRKTIERDEHGKLRGVLEEHL